MDQIFGSLEPDEAAADHHSTPRRLDELNSRVVVHAREEDGAFLDPLADRAHVRHGTHLKDARQIDPGQGWPDRGRTRREHQLVVGFGLHLAGADVAQLHGLLFARNRDCLAVGPRVDPEHAAEGLHIRDQQARLLLNHARYVIGQAAVRVGDVRAAFHHHDFYALIQPAQACSTRCTTRHSTNNDDFHELSPQKNHERRQEPLSV